MRGRIPGCRRRDEVPGGYGYGYGAIILDRCINATFAAARGGTIWVSEIERRGAFMGKHPLPSLALIAFDAKKRRSAERAAAAERQRQLFLEPALRYCPGMRDPRLVQTAEEDE
jgi:hypothetical protein